MSAEGEVMEIIRSGKDCPADRLMPLFEQLQPIDAASMIGTWKGGKFDSSQPDPINWYGKRFVSASHVEPLLARKPDGTIYSYEGLGVAQLREVAHGGKVQATLIYDKQPMMDYFRKVTDDVVIGLGDIKGRPLNFFFWLEREK